MIPIQVSHRFRGGPQIPSSFNLWASPNLWEKKSGFIVIPQQVVHLEGG